MALSEDSLALLRLLLSGQGYDQIAQLLGSSPDQVRERAHAALAELDEPAGSELSPELADALLGQARGPVGADQPGAKRAAALAERLREVAPGEHVAPPTFKTGADGAPAPPAGASPGRTGTDRRVLGLIGLGGLAILVVVLIISGAFGGSGGGSGGPGRPADPSEDVVAVDLQPVGGATASGQIRLVRVQDLPTLVLDLKGLEPTPRGETYLVWLYNSETEAFPVGFRDVGANGVLRGTLALPDVSRTLLPEFKFLDVSLARDDEAERSIRQTGASGIPEHAGRSVLRGSLRPA